MIHPKSYPTYNERQQKIIEMIDWALEKYKAASNMKKINEQVIIDNIIEELDKKRDIAINNKKQALFKDDVSMYRLEENTIDYVLFRIREMTGKFCYQKKTLLKDEVLEYGEEEDTIDYILFRVRELTGNKLY